MTIGFLFIFLQWQQRVAYKIDAHLDPETHSITAQETLRYYNNSPYVLETLYIHLYANAYKDLNTTYAQETKKMGVYGDAQFLNAKESERGYSNIKNITAAEKSLNFKIDETIMMVFLNEPLKSGDSSTLVIDYFLKIPEQFSRLGYKDNHYEIVHWYPKICVFDTDGWHRDAYHALGEFYGEFGSFDVTLDLPSNYIVAATGELISEKYSDYKDSIVFGTDDNFETNIEMNKMKKVRFFAENVHDFAWVGDPDYAVKKCTVDSIDIFIFYFKRNKKSWENAEGYARDAIKRYNQWYGKYPYKNLSIVNGYAPGGAGTEYPNLVIISINEDYFTRSFEQAIIHEIGHQWFYGVLGSNEIDEAWLDEGFTSYTEIRYFEDKYGKENSLFKLSILSPLSINYYHKLIYYITQTNQLEKPVLTPAYEFIETPFAYENGAYSKPALFLCNLEGILGKERFAKILRDYFQAYKFKHPKTEDFIEICERESGINLKTLFYPFLNSTDFCDWAVEKIIGNKVELENRGNFFIPTSVFIEAAYSSDTFYLNAPEKYYTITVPKRAGKIKKVIVDPSGYTLEPTRWNNYYPRKIKIKPIFAFPSFDAYQILFLPYLWYSSYDGFTPGIYFFGAEFIDFDFVKGRHQWIAGGIYGIKSERYYPLFAYQTPIIFSRSLKIRITFINSNSNDENKVNFGFINNIGRPFSQKPAIEITNMLRYDKVNSYHSLDSMDWELGKNIIFDNRFRLSHAQWQINIGLAWANEILGGEWNYLKVTGELNKEINAFIPFKLRFFAGNIFGQAPTQENLFLSGAMRITLLADLLFSQKGYFSPQEHLHISGDGNMIGYQTMHIRSNKMYCVNLELPSNFMIRCFADFGFCGDYAFDFGAKIVLGPISFNFPFYTKTDAPWKFRWSIGL